MPIETKTIEVTVMRYAAGAPVGTIAMSPEAWRSYADEADPRFQWPGGTAEAGEVLTDAALARLGLDNDTVIYLD